MKMNEQIAAMMRGGRFDEAQYACMDRLRASRLDFTAWALLGKALKWRGRPRMAAACFERASLLDPYAPWLETLRDEACEEAPGPDEAAVLQLLAVPAASVSACILTRDSQRTIAACLAAVQPAVDDVIVVDTGSTDDTVAIVESFGIPVHHFAWVDDFAAARNYAQSLASSDWVVAIDSDEVLDPADTAAIRTIAGLLHHQEWLVQLLQVNTASPRGIVARMFQAGEFTWERPIHEQPAWVHRGTERALSSLIARIRVHHDGYDPAVVDLPAKLARNRRILEAVVARDPQDALSRYYLGRECLHLGDAADAEPHLVAAWELGVAIPGFTTVPEIGAVLYELYTTTGRPDEACAVAQRLMAARPEHPGGWFYYGLSLMDMQPVDMPRAVAVLQEAKSRAVAYRGPANLDPAIGAWKADYLLGQLAQVACDWPEAAARFQAVLRTQPDHTDTQQRLRAVEAQM